MSGRRHRTGGSTNPFDAIIEAEQAESAHASQAGDSVSPALDMPYVEETSQSGLLDTAAEAFGGVSEGWANFDEIEESAAAEAGGDLSEMEIADLITMVQDDPRLQEQFEWHTAGNMSRNARKARHGSGGTRAGMAASKIPVVGAIKQAMHMRDARKKVRMYRNMRDRQGARNEQVEDINAVMSHGLKHNHQRKARKDGVGLATQPAAIAAGVFTGGMGTEAAGEFFAGASELVVEGIEKGAKTIGQAATTAGLETAGEKSKTGAGKLGGGQFAFEDYSPGAGGGSGYQRVTEHRMDDAHTVRALAHYLGPARQSEEALGDFGAHDLNENARLELKRRLGSAEDEDMAARPKTSRGWGRSSERLTPEERLQYNELSRSGKKSGGFESLGETSMDEINALAMMWEGEGLWRQDKLQQRAQQKKLQKTSHSRYTRLDEDD
mgnify:CR=1 FL=1